MVRGRSHGIDLPFLDLPFLDLGNGLGQGQLPGFTAPHRTPLHLAELDPFLTGPTLSPTV